MVGVAESSASEAVAVQVSSPVFVVPFVLILAVMTGVVFSTVSLTLSVAVAFRLSVTVDIHVMSSVGLELVDDRTSVSPEPNSVPLASIHS